MKGTRRLHINDMGFLILEGKAEKLYLSKDVEEILLQSLFDCNCKNQGASAEIYIFSL